MHAYQVRQEQLQRQPTTWLVIGYQRNLDEVEGRFAPEEWQRFRFIQGDIRDLATCRSACSGVDYVLHQAALRRSRIRSTPTRTNITGFLNMVAGRR